MKFIQSARTYAGGLLLGLLAAQGAAAQSYNYFAGEEAGAHNTRGSNNTLVGYAAGNGNTEGMENTYLGFMSGFFNQTGDRNTFVGAETGVYNQAGLNVFLGYRAGTANTLGKSNTFVGAETGSGNTRGNYNTFVGQHAGAVNSEGNYNTFVGRAAGQKNTLGSANTFLGNLAGAANTTGIENTFLGQEAGQYNTTGSYNVFIGNNAGVYNQTGGNNVFVGNQAGQLNDSGLANTFLGQRAGAANVSGGQNTFTGYQAGWKNTSGLSNTFSGTFAGYFTSEGINNSFFGAQAGTNNATGYHNTAMGFQAGPHTGNLSYATAIGSRALVTVSNALVLGAIKDVNDAPANTNVGIGLTNPSHQLHLSTDDAAKPGSAFWKVASDKRLKKDISAFKDGLAVLKQVNPVWFQYTGEAGTPTGRKYVGVIAQEMQKIAHYTVGTFTHQDTAGKKTDYLSYDANSLLYIVVNAVKELEGQHRQEIDAKNARLEAQQKQLEALEARLRKLEAAGSAAGRTGVTPEAPATTEAFPTARLWQNQPNPYGQSTLIRYLVPATATAAELRVFSLTGEQVYRRALTTGGEGQVEISGQQLPAGTYQYCLVVDGQVVDTRKMILTP
jgi:hypothetical protein